MLIIGSRPPTSNNLEHCQTIDGCSVDSSSSVRNQGVLFYSNLSFDSHFSSICKTDFFHLKNISKLRAMLSISNDEMLIHAFKTSRLDFYFFSVQDNAQYGSRVASSEKSLQFFVCFFFFVLDVVSIMVSDRHTLLNISSSVG